MNYGSAPPLEVADDFRQVMGQSPTPVTIVTAATPDGSQGIVIGSFVSVSLEPPLVGFFVGKWTRMWQPMSAATAFCINVLAADQSRLSHLFTQHGIDRFAASSWEPAANGAPALDGAVAWIEAGPYSLTDAGDHDLILLRVTGIRSRDNEAPLVYHRGAYKTVAPAD